MYLSESFAPSYEAKFASNHSFCSNSITEKKRFRATNTSIETDHVSLALKLDLVDPG